MNGAVRLFDRVTSYCRFTPSGPFITASHKVFIEGRGAVRLLDKSITGVVVTGSRKNFIEGRPAVRRIDKVICGIIKSSSNKVFYG